MKRIALVLLASICVLQAQRYPFTEIRRAGAGTTATATNAIAWDASGVGTNTTLYNPYILNGTFTNCSFFDVILPGEIDTDLTGSRAVITDEDGILSVTDTTSAEIQYVHNVRAAIQTQFDTITNGGYHTNIIVSRSWLTNCYLTNGVIGGGYASNIISYNGYFTNAIISKSIATNGITVIGDLQTAIAASRAVATDANSNLVASATTATELGYVNGVTNPIQTQINSLTRPGVTSTFTAAGTTNTVTFAIAGPTYKSIIVNSNFTLCASGYYIGAAMAIRLEPDISLATDFTVTVDGAWQRYGANFSAAALTIHSNKNTIISLNSWGTAATNAVAAYKEQQ